MPSKKTPSGEYKDVAHPINSQARQSIQMQILEAYENLPEDFQQEEADAETLKTF